MQSIMPTPDEIREQLFVKIIRFRKQITEANEVHTLVRVGGQDASAQVVIIDDKRVNGYLPSKVRVVIDADGNANALDFVFYTSAAIAQRAKVFNDEQLCAFAIISSSAEEVIEYPVEANMLIDQQWVAGGKVAYIFVFPRSEWAAIIDDLTE